MSFRSNCWRFLLIAVITMNIVAASCSAPNNEDPCITNGNTEIVGEGKISGDVATMIAKARIAPEVDLKMLDSTATEEPERWVIQFSLKPEFKEWTGGQAVVLVDKKNGEVISSYIGK